jgi:glycosyltransferase involved in cell wall biosynthesis
MGSGLPCLAVSAGGVLEFARHGQNAWLVHPNDPTALCQGLGHLLRRPDLRHTLALGGLTTAGEKTWDKVYDQLIEDYRDAIESNRVVRAA